MNIGVDIDGVLTDIRNFQIKKGQAFFNKELVNKDGFTIQEMFNCTDDESKKFWTKYLLEYSIFFGARLNASKIISEYKSNNKIFIITSRAFTNENNFLGKLMRYIVREWLKINNIPYDKIIYCGESKKDEIINNNINVMIEDNRDNAIELSNYTKVILLDQEYNRDVNKENVFRANDWEQIGYYLKFFSNLYKKNAYFKKGKNTGYPSIDKPWLKYYSYAQSLNRIPDLSIYQYMENGVLNNLNREVLNYVGRSINGKEFLDNIESAKKSILCMFNSFGINENNIHNETISIISNNIPEALYVFYAANRLGVLVNFIHPLSSKDNIISSIKKCNSKIVFCIDFDYSKVKDMVKEQNIYKVVILSNKDSMPLYMKLLYSYKLKDLDFYKDNRTEIFISWDKFKCLSLNDINIPDYPFEKNRPQVILSTGGTTGEPKGALLTNENFNSMPSQYGVKANFDKNDKMVAVMPIFHGFGLCNCIHMPLCLGASVILMPKYDSKSLAHIFKKYKPNDIMGVPTLMRDILYNKDYSKIDFSFINYIVSGGGPMGSDEELFNKFLKEKNSNKAITKGYGLTEATSSVTFTFEDCNEINSVGIPLVNTNIKVVKPGSTKELKYNELGEICASGPSIMKSYYKDKEATDKDLIIHEDGKIWLHTGDIGYINEDGKLFVTDRMKRLIIVSGINVYPSLIENALSSHPAVKECCVIKMPHSYKFEVPKAYVVLNEGYVYDIDLEKELFNLCSSLPNKYYLPEKIEVINELPKTLMNKIDYKYLEEKENNSVKILRKENKNV